MRYLNKIEEGGLLHPGVNYVTEFFTDRPEFKHAFYVCIYLFHKVIIRILFTTVFPYVRLIKKLTPDFFAKNWNIKSK